MRWWESQGSLYKGRIPTLFQTGRGGGISQQDTSWRQQQNWEHSRPPNPPKEEPPHPRVTCPATSLSPQTPYLMAHDLVVTPCTCDCNHPVCAAPASGSLAYEGDGCLQPLLQALISFTDKATAGKPLVCPSREWTGLGQGTTKWVRLWSVQSR